MRRNLFCCVVAVAFTSLPAGLMAGGPPFLCLPVDGVTSENSQAGTELLDSRLEKLMWKHSRELQKARIVQRNGQAYLTFYMGSDVRLSDIQAALDKTGYGVPRDRLRLFGHAILEISGNSAAHQQLLADLEALPFVSVSDSKFEQDVLVVTLDMPYPVEHGRADRESVGWDTFRRNDRSSDQAARSQESAATSHQLPSYKDFRNVVAKHEASLKDIRWSQNFACRALGGVAEPPSKAKVSVER